MGENSNGSSWQAKDILVAMPVLASSLAVSWEIGRMMPFGGFSFFTLSEHLLSALRALPIALVTAALLVLLFGLFKHAAANHLPKKPGRLFLGMLAMMSALLILIHYLGQSWTEVIDTVAIDIAILGFVANAFWFRMPFSGTAGILVTAGAAIAGAITLGYSMSAQLIERAKVDASALSTVTYKNGNKKEAFLVMSGERGLLLYDPATKRVTFERLDDVKTVEWDK